MRSTREEGIGDELRAMNDEARGSPFFDAPVPKAPVTNASMKAPTLLDRLRQLGALTEAKK